MMETGSRTFWMDTFEEHGSAVLAFLTSRLGRRDVAEDLLQETFVRAIRADSRFPDSRTARSYLMTTAHRLMLDRFRRKKPLLFSEAGEDGGRFEQVPDPRASSPDFASELSRFGERLDEVLGGLRPAYRDAFRLAVLEQLPYREIAEKRGWSLEKVKANVHRSRKQVMARMQDLMGTAESAP